MIVDTINNWHLYPMGESWNDAFKFIVNMPADINDGYYEITGDKVFARVMSYNTVVPNLALLETHEKYVDIQTVIYKGERIDWIPKKGLNPLSEYLIDKDATYYYHPNNSQGSINVIPGIFVALFPDDAHMPQLIIDEERKIKKVVVKIQVDTFNFFKNLL